jgi:tetratricopeptide (TPR) repeat protein
MTYRAKALILFLTLLALPAWGLSATPVEDALALIDAGRFDEARAHLGAIVDGSGPVAERADALELLGDVEVWADDLDAARGIWRRVVEEFPGSAASSYARTKLRLVAEILGPEDSAAPASHLAAAAPPKASAEAPMEASVEAPAAAPAPASASAPALAAPAPAQPMSTPAAEWQLGTLLLAGDGTPQEAIEPVLDLVLEHLRTAGVVAEIPGQMLWWRREWKSAEPAMLEAAAGNGVLWLDFRFGHRELLVAHCFDGRGDELWREKVSGGTGFADHRPYDTYNAELVERLLAKLDRRLGDACLSLPS